MKLLFGVAALAAVCVAAPVQATDTWTFTGTLTPDGSGSAYSTLSSPLPYPGYGTYGVTITFDEAVLNPVVDMMNDYTYTDVLKSDGSVIGSSENQDSSALTFAGLTSRISFDVTQYVEGWNEYYYWEDVSIQHQLTDIHATTDDTVGYKMVITFLSSGVPEPATWTMMLLGFGLLGGALRRSRLEGDRGKRVRVRAVGIAG